MIEASSDAPSRIQKPTESPSNGTLTFMPQIDAISVGMESTSVSDVSTFMMSLTLLLMTEEKASMVEERMSR